MVCHHTAQSNVTALLRCDLLQEFFTPSNYNLTPFYVLQLVLKFQVAEDLEYFHFCDFTSLTFYTFTEKSKMYQTNLLGIA